MPESLNINGVFFEKKNSRAAPKCGMCRVKKIFQKMLILAFEVFVQPHLYTHYIYCTIFPFLEHCIAGGKGGGLTAGAGRSNFF